MCCCCDVILNVVMLLCEHCVLLVLNETVRCYLEGNLILLVGLVMKSMMCGSHAGAE